MPISFDLEKLRVQFNCVNYFETGLWDPRDINISSRKALACGFKNIFSMEIRSDFINLAKDIFSQDILTGRYNLILDDSTNLYKYLNNNIFDDKTMFFLDAHVDNPNIKNYTKRCPLLSELDAIKNINRKDNIILVDDVRELIKPYPWNETSYGPIIFLDSIKEKILSINKNYKFQLLDGHIKDDVLLAYI